MDKIDLFSGKSLGILNPKDFRSRKRINKYISEIPEDIIGEAKITENLRLKYKGKITNRKEDILEFYVNFTLVTIKT